MMEKTKQQAALCDQNPTDFSDLKAIYLNCTLKHPDQPSHTALLLGASADIMRRNGVAVEHIRGSAHRIAFGVQPDMREHGWARRYGWASSRPFAGW